MLNMLKSIIQLVQEIHPGLRCVSAENVASEVKTNNGILIDVRELTEFDEKSANLSVNIPRVVLEMKIAAVCPTETNAIHVHCATGARATFAAKQLVRLGYRNVSMITCDLDTIICSQA